MKVFNLIILSGWNEYSDLIKYFLKVLNLYYWLCINSSNRSHKSHSSFLNYIHFIYSLLFSIVLKKKKRKGSCVEGRGSVDKLIYYLIPSPWSRFICRRRQMSRQTQDGALAETGQDIPNKVRATHSNYKN